MFKSALLKSAQLKLALLGIDPAFPEDFELILPQPYSKEDFTIAATAILEIFSGKKILFIPGDAQIIPLNRECPCKRSALPLPNDCVFYTHHEGC